MNASPVPPWLATWPTTYPCRRGPWTVRNGDRWGALVPETGEVTIVDPAYDQALPGLRPALASGSLLSYRVGRRAVVATTDHFVKVVRPKRVERVVGNHQTVSRLATCTVPTVVDYESDGRITVSAISGDSLHQKLRHGCLDAHCEDAECLNPGDLDVVADAVAALHDTSPPTDLGSHADAGDWIDAIERFDDGGARFLRTIHDHIPKVPTGRAHIVHGDLHDKNLIFGSDGVGLIDLDGLSAGVAEVDVGNLTAHLMLRALQAGAGEAVGRSQVSEFLEAYRRRRPLDQTAVAAVQRQTWLRLSGLYQFRQTSRHLVAILAQMASVQDGGAGE